MAKTTKIQPRLSRIDFYRLRGDEFIEAVFDSIERCLGGDRQRVNRWSRLNSYQQGIYGWWQFYGEVQNGGLAQFFYNRADVFLPPIAGLLKASNNAVLVAPLKQATSIYRKNKKQFAVKNPFGTEGLFARMTELRKLDRVVVRQLPRASKALEKWLRANLSRIALLDPDGPIDPTFSGEIQSYHPNGKLFEQATISKGTLSGPYRRYLPDGTLEHSCFYQRGEVCTDYWPNGQPKHKVMKRGNLKVYEWYFPSGHVQKRLVANKSNDAVEPVRLWYDNGQLAEELHVRAGKKFGPWLKFFDDGSPRLQAEHCKGETVVVKNAWDDHRRQVVKNGRGTYFDDGQSIDVYFKLFFNASWTHSRQLRGGIPHGLSITWEEGVLWSRDNYARGKLHGVSTAFYDNGRVRTRSVFRAGKQIKTEEFPKFDDPRPAVVLKVQADDDLYNAWGHPLLNVYPTARNLKRVEAQLEPPEFLEGVFARNKAGEVEDDYEDWNTFDDNIAYMAMVNERGTVDSVNCSGSGVYSAAVVDKYPPAIRRLIFKPGRIGKRKVRCQVVVWVHHTFVEAQL